MQELPMGIILRQAPRPSIFKIPLQGPNEEDFNKISTRSSRKDLRKIMQGPFKGSPWVVVKHVEPAVISPLVGPRCANNDGWLWKASNVQQEFTRAQRCCQRTACGRQRTLGAKEHLPMQVRTRQELCWAMSAASMRFLPRNQDFAKQPGSWEGACAYQRSSNAMLMPPVLHLSLVLVTHAAHFGASGLPSMPTTLHLMEGTGILKSIWQ